MPPFFSIIIPVFNSAATLAATVDSISNQTFTDYEIVFVDGGSTDNSIKIIYDLNKTLQTTSISEPDKGIYDAMNKGIALAKGEWLYFMGSDDLLYSPDVLDSIHREIVREPADLIYGNVTGESSLTHYIYDTLPKVLSQGIHHQSIFYKRSVFEAIGKYDLFFKIAADFHLTLKAFLHPGIKTRYVNLEIAHFGESGLSSQQFDYTFYSSHYKLLAENNALDKVEQPEKLLEKSIYCCLFMAKQKKDVDFARKNLWFYATHAQGLKFGSRVKTVLQMMYWIIKPAGKLSIA